MINVGVVGMGNLGKAVCEEVQKSKEFKLVAKFSKRDLPGCKDYKNIKDYVGKIELLFVCGGSKTELEKQTDYLIDSFNIIESFDNHAKIKSHMEKSDKFAKKHKKIMLCSFGWDPGLFSLMRGLISGLGFTPYTFWGRGLSQGHTEAIKKLPGVVDALQFTVPNKKIMKKIKHGEEVSIDKSFHKRDCFIVARKQDRKRIEEQIKTMPDYFCGYETSVNFVSQDELDKMKSFSHRGTVLTAKNIINFSLNLPSNPAFTAKVLCAFAKSYKKLKENKNFGAFSIFDLPLGYILDKEKYYYL